MNTPVANVLEYRPLLMKIAMEFLGNFKDAEDAVQDTFLKWFERDTSRIQNIRTYLIVMLKNICLNWVKRTQKFKEIHEELFESENSTQSLPTPWADFDMEKELSNAYETMMRKLNISEKAVYLMREVFQRDYQDIADIVGKKVENCRKIFDRAKKRLEEKNERFREEAIKTQESFQHFLETCRNGNHHDFGLFLKGELQKSLG